MKIKLLLLIGLASICFRVNAQDSIPPRPDDPLRTQKPSFADRLFFGGDIGLQFGDVTYINIAPIIGYKVTDAFGVGLGPSYTYVKDKRYVGYEYTASSYGGRMFGQYRVVENAMAYGEYSLVNADVFDEFTLKQKRVNIPSLLLGGGYMQPIGDASSFNLMVLFNVIEDNYSYYQNPIIRAGLNVGF
jgi:hypothetical protein